MSPGSSLTSALAKDREGRFGAVAEPSLLSRLDVAAGAVVSIGSASLTLNGTLGNEPDKLAGGLGFGPRLMIGLDALRASGLLQPGSLVRWHYRLRLPAASDDAVAAVAAAAKERLDAGWDIRTRAAAAPQLERNVERFSQYLTLVGLAALMIGGVGVANAVKHHLDRKRDTIATLKAVGATGTSVVIAFFVQVMMVAAIGVAIGVAVGTALPFVIVGIVAPLVPLPFVAGVHADAIAVAAAFGFMTAATFALWPLGRAHDVPASALFRDEVASERRLAAQALHRRDRGADAHDRRSCGRRRRRPTHRRHLRRRGRGRLAGAAAGGRPPP